LIRGVAVLGILAVNIASYSGAGSASYSPNLPVPGSPADRWAFLGMLVLFEGKMRALFSVLFGASMVLFIERAEARGEYGDALQLRRLGWLALFGFLHFLLLWQWDILFLYAVVGLLALPLRHLPARAQLAAALLIFAAWQGWGYDQWRPALAAEAAVSAGTASPAQDRENTRAIATYRSDDHAEIAVLGQSWPDLVSTKLRERLFMPLIAVIFVSGETLPLMLIGMALLQSGFFSGGWPRRRLALVAAGGMMLGGAATLWFAHWANRTGFPEMAMRFFIGYGLGFAHLAMALGYAALLVLSAPRLLETGLGQRLAAAGQTAFSNYVGTSLVMTAIFYGWGLGLVGQFGSAAQFGFVLLGWTLMLIWSPWWLARFRQGPLEWLWRGLTEGRFHANLNR
jgi:uncharacterized protein